MSLTRAEAVRQLVAIGERDSRDPETAHSEADRILLEFVPIEVAVAYRAVVDACAWWATA